MKPFSLLIKPACGDCNLRCEYCFYLNKCDLYPQAVRHRMTDEVLQRIVKSFMETDQAQHSFAWQGGEPALMGLDFFKRVVSLQEKHGRAGQVVANGLQTNGTLITDEFAKHLAKHQFLVGVSLDGPASVHDAYRKYADGRGTHADVMSGIANLVQNNVEFNILTLVSRSNASRGREVYRYLCDNGFFYHQYIECVEFDKKGRLMPFALSGEEWGDFLCEIFDEWIKSDTRKVSIRLFDSILLRLVDDVVNCCPMGTDCRQYLVVEHNGDVYPCDFFVEPDKKLGNIMENPWQKFLGSHSYVGFGSKKRELNARCEACEYLVLCAGDCPKHRYRDGEQPRKLSELCAGWKKFYDHTLPEFERLATEIRSERARAERRAGPGVSRQGQGCVGRNDPCTYGSGKKFKNCCGD